MLVGSPHEQAWKAALRQLMETEWADVRDRSEWSDERFTPQVYQQVISGKPRVAGALAGLEYFKIPDAAQRVPVYAAHTQDLLIRLIEENRFDAYPDALRFVMAVRGSGVPVSRRPRPRRTPTYAAPDPPRHVRRAGRPLLRLPPAGPGAGRPARRRPVGTDFEHGKPDPEIFVTSAGELRIVPEDCFVVEDAVSGV
ncbi:HAD family phosphatase [Pseudonocardia zijingensis]|uniref:HAD family phosphatase n=1 Tax=Pseudonocardia zijingensis TaxID=153376 RepID=UPI0031D3C8B1